MATQKSSASRTSSASASLTSETKTTPDIAQQRRMAIDKAKDIDEWLSTDFKCDSSVIIAAREEVLSHADGLFQADEEPLLRTLLPRTFQSLNKREARTSTMARFFAMHKLRARVASQSNARAARTVRDARSRSRSRERRPRQSRSDGNDGNHNRRSDKREHDYSSPEDRLALDLEALGISIPDPDPNNRQGLPSPQIDAPSQAQLLAEVERVLRLPQDEKLQALRRILPTLNRVLQPNAFAQLMKEIRQAIAQNLRRPRTDIRSITMGSFRENEFLYRISDPVLRSIRRYLLNGGRFLQGIYSIVSTTSNQAVGFDANAHLKSMQNLNLSSTDFVFGFIEILCHEFSIWANDATIKEQINRTRDQLFVTCANELVKRGNSSSVLITHTLFLLAKDAPLAFQDYPAQFAVKMKIAESAVKNPPENRNAVFCFDFFVFGVCKKKCGKRHACPFCGSHSDHSLKACPLVPKDKIEPVKRSVDIWNNPRKKPVNLFNGNTKFPYPPRNGFPQQNGYSGGYYRGRGQNGYRGRGTRGRGRGRGYF